MIGSVNTGGGTKAFAFIVVTYLTGSVCTCTDGTKTLRAKNTTGTWVFDIPYAGTWTVSCTDGEQTDSESVVISYKGQSENVALSFGFYIIKNGAYQIPLTNVYGFAITSSSVVAENGNHECAVRTKDKYDFTDTPYRYIVVKVLATTSPHNYPLDLVVTDRNVDYEDYEPSNPNNPPTGAILYAKKQPIEHSTINELTLDIGTLTGSHYIGIGIGYFLGASVLDLYLRKQQHDYLFR